MKISDLISVVTTIRLDQHQHVTEAQPVNRKTLASVQIAGALRRSPSGFDQASCRLRNCAPPVQIDGKGKMIQRRSVLPLRCIGPSGQQLLHQGIARAWQRLRPEAIARFR